MKWVSPVKTSRKEAEEIIIMRLALPEKGMSGGITVVSSRPFKGWNLSSILSHRYFKIIIYIHGKNYYDYIWGNKIYTLNPLYLWGWAPSRVYAYVLHPQRYGGFFIMVKQKNGETKND